MIPNKRLIAQESVEAFSRVVVDLACETAENPLWNDQEQALYWTDIPNGVLYRYFPAQDSYECIYNGRPVGGFTFQRDGSLLLFMDRGTVAIWKDGKLETLIEEIPDERETRFNDVIADPEGRVFCGSLFGPKGPGRLYRLDRDGTLHLLLEGVACSNGMAFSLDGTRFYFTDSFAYRIYEFDYERASGRICNQRVFATVPDAMGFPDGCTMTADGELWTALWEGGCIACLDRAGSVRTTVPLPVKRPTSLAFAGGNLKDLFVTSGGGSDRSEDPFAGALLMVNTPARGVPDFRSDVSIGS